ncbi:MAG: sodium-dependent transporter [Duncaniella sp.]|nr:sodium-dependent transporter [Duncaniella sp.]
MASSPKFASKIGLIAATVGSAVGLGNVWRFPAETQANGGAAFLLIYIFCIFLLGIPVMTAEFALGRGGESDAAGVFSKVTPNHRHWRMAGAFSVLASYLILSFYMVVSGWTLEYLIQSLSGNLYSGIHAGTTGEEAMFASRMADYIASAWSPILYTAIMVIANLGILLLGVQKGIEKMSNIAMPILFIILVIFCGVSLTLPDAAAGLEYFLKPDFSVVTPRTLINALGQAFFSLSLAMGILVTYAAYYPPTTRLTRTAVTVSLLDLLVAIMMGVIIFPAVTSFGLTGSSLKGSTLVFVTLPEIFARMDWSSFWSALFFLLLTVAAFTSTISLAEVSVSFVRQRLGCRRRTACLIVVLPLLIFSPICSLSVGPWSDHTIFGLTLFDLLDTVATNYMLPIGGILLCIYMGWVAPRSFLEAQVTNNGSFRSAVLPVILFIIRYIAPVLIAIILLAPYF